jgi:hypothetical protein
MKRLPLFFLSLVTLIFVACASQRVAMPKQTAKGYGTYRFYNPNLENLPVFADRTVQASKIIQQRLAERLEGIGLRQAAEDAELLVAHLLVVQNNAVSTTINDYYLNSGSEILSVAHDRVANQELGRSIEIGTLVVDVVDIKQQKLIYRSYATRDIVEGMSDAQRETYVQSAVDEAIARFVK